MYEYRHIDELLRPRKVPLGRLGAPESLLDDPGLKCLGTDIARAAANRFSQCASALAGESNGSVEVLGAFVPGRIEVLGKHTDYAGGGSLVCALQRGICLVAVPLSEKKLSLLDVASGETCDVALSAEEPSRRGDWSDYAVSVGRRLVRDFPEISVGSRIAFASDLPRASGMSSSSALVVGLALAIIAVNDLGNLDRFTSLFSRPEDLAQYLGAVENGLSFLTLKGDTGVGTYGGSEDHTAILCSQPGLLKWYSYAPVRFREAVALPHRYAFALAFSGLHAEKTGAVLDRYNYLSASSSEIAASWRRVMKRDEPHLGAISQVPGYSRTEVALAIRESPGENYSIRDLTSRLDQFHHENNIILPGAVEALENGRVDRFGELVDRSQNLAEELLRNQTPETVFLAREARSLGAAAASAFGAGFGGSVWALVHEDGLSSFVADWSDSYSSAFPEAAQSAVFFTDWTGPAAFWLSDPKRNPRDGLLT